MKSIATLLLIFSSFSGYAFAASSASEHKLGAAVEADPARIYHLADGVFRILNRHTTEIEGLNHITIIGAVKRPGVYYFKDAVSLKAIIESAEPFPADSNTAHTCGSADLTKICIMSGSMRDRDIPSQMFINFKKYLEAAKDGRLAQDFLLQGGVIQIFEFI